MHTMSLVECVYACTHKCIYICMHGKSFSNACTRRCAHRRIFNEYDVWEGYRNRPLIPRENNTQVHLAGDMHTHAYTCIHVNVPMHIRPEISLYIHT
jgi:hypothetical protein